MSLLYKISILSGKVLLAPPAPSEFNIEALANLILFLEIIFLYYCLATFTSLLSLNGPSPSD